VLGWKGWSLAVGGWQNYFNAENAEIAEKRKLLSSLNGLGALCVLGG
jgi:hypothetical protein